MLKIQAVVLLFSLAIVGCANLFNDAMSADQAAAKVKLTAVLEARSDALKARDLSRHPRETLEFFGIMPSMKVAEVLPGGGWYTQILAPYIGTEGAIYGINYADTMWPMFGFFSENMIANRIAAMDAFDEIITGIAGANMTAKGFAFDRIPASLNDSLDAVLMIRATHNLNRFEETAGTRTRALQEVYALLKPGGIVGVVQHRAPIEADNAWANGSNGYLKQQAVIEMFATAGFELVASSEINSNPNDKPSIKDSVWRLPPSLRTPPENEAAMRAIGESDRMTLKFIKK